MRRKYLIIVLEFDHEVNDRLRPITHPFYTIELEERWHLCIEAQKVVRYEIDQKSYRGMDAAKFYEFQYNDKKWMEIYLAIRCFSAPRIFVHRGRSVTKNDNDNVITITLVAVGFWSNYEMDAIKNV